MKTKEFFEEKLVEFREFVYEEELKNISFNQNVEFISYYVSMKELFNEDYWNGLAIPLWFLNEVLKMYANIASNWYAYALKNKISFKINYIICDPHYIFSDIRIISSDEIDGKEGLFPPDKFFYPQKFVWSKKDAFDEYSLFLDELNSQEIRDLEQRGFKKKFIYNNEDGSLEDLIFQKKIGDNWIGRLYTI